LTLARELVGAVCTAAILISLLHFGYHAANLELFSVGTAAGQTAGLTVAVALPLLTLLATRSPERTTT
jgi:hypothetical protein